MLVRLLYLPQKRDRRKSSSQLLLEGSKREAEDKIVPQEIDADDSDVEPKSDDERFVPLSFSAFYRNAPVIILLLA
ncbi:Cwf15 / Cwc15 cell cycle control family protein [Zea mays]|nr:Cwf15 / Cwc15 cell cycle control family protein [Zea mays]